MDAILDSLGGFGSAFFVLVIAGGFSAVVPSGIEWVDKLKKKRKEQML